MSRSTALAGVVFATAEAAAEDGELFEQSINGLPLWLRSLLALASELPRQRVWLVSESEELCHQAKRLGFSTLLWSHARAASIGLIDELPTGAALPDLFSLAEFQSSSRLLILFPWQLFVRRSLIAEACGEVIAPGGFFLETGGFLALERNERDLWSELIELPSCDAMRLVMHSVADYPLQRLLARGLHNHSDYEPGFAASLLQRRVPIKLVVFDVDGTLTDGGMYLNERGEDTKRFHTRDGIGIQAARRGGIDIAFLSSGFKQTLVEQRGRLLGVERIHVGREPKRDVLEMWRQEMGLEWSEIAFVGDDINDLAAAVECGLFAAPADAHSEVVARADWVLERRGGEGCVREFLDALLAATTARGLAEYD